MLSDCGAIQAEFYTPNASKSYWGKSTLKDDTVHAPTPLNSQPLHQRRLTVTYGNQRMNQGFADGATKDEDE